MDRIDLHVAVPRPDTSVLDRDKSGAESSREVAKRVRAARALQINRQGHCNAILQGETLDRHCQLSDNDREFLKKAAEQLTLSPRATHRVLKVARTIADLDQQENIGQTELAEALGLRQPRG